MIPQLLAIVPIMSLFFPVVVFCWFGCPFCRSSLDCSLSCKRRARREGKIIRTNQKGCVYVCIYIYIYMSLSLSLCLSLSLSRLCLYCGVADEGYSFLQSTAKWRRNGVGICSLRRCFLSRPSCFLYCPNLAI